MYKRTEITEPPPGRMVGGGAVVNKKRYRKEGNLPKDKECFERSRGGLAQRRGQGLRNMRAAVGHAAASSD